MCNSDSRTNSKIVSTQRWIDHQFLQWSALLEKWSAQIGEWVRQNRRLHQCRALIKDVESDWIDWCRYWNLSQRRTVAEHVVSDHCDWAWDCNWLQTGAAVESAVSDDCHRIWNQELRQWSATIESVEVNDSDRWWNDQKPLHVCALSESMAADRINRRWYCNTLQRGALSEGTVAYRLNEGRNRDSLHFFAAANWVLSKFNSWLFQQVLKNIITVVFCSKE